MAPAAADSIKPRGIFVYSSFVHEVHLMLDSASLCVCMNVFVESRGLLTSQDLIISLVLNNV